MPTVKQQPGLGVGQDALPAELALPHRDAQEIKDQEVNRAGRRSLPDGKLSVRRRGGGEGEEKAAEPAIDREGKEEETLIRQPMPVGLENRQPQRELEEHGCEGGDGGGCHNADLRGNIVHVAGRRPGQDA